MIYLYVRVPPGDQGPTVFAYQNTYSLLTNGPAP